jgi:hypothetical protein
LRRPPRASLPHPREVVDRLGASDIDEERPTAATAQFWVVLALTLVGERTEAETPATLLARFPRSAATALKTYEQE